MEGELGAKERRPRAVFMAFGTKGDVYPIAALATAFACDQQHYQVVLITHLAHQSLSAHLACKNVAYMPVSSAPVLAAHQHDNISVGSEGEIPQSHVDQISFSSRKKIIQKEHRQECLSALEGIFGDDPSMEGDFIAINFFALEGWHLAELFQVECVITAPYLVPYRYYGFSYPCAPSSFERQFRQELPFLYKYFQEAPANTVWVCWKDIAHWMWPLFMDNWGSWRSDCLNLSPVPFTDPVTNLPLWHMRAQSPLLLYGFSKEIVEFPGYWPSNVYICGFWFLPMEWQFSCHRCREIFRPNPYRSVISMDRLCANHAALQNFLMDSSRPCLPVFVGLNSIGSMGFLRNPQAFLMVLEAVVESTEYKFVLFSSGYKPLDATIQLIAGASSKSAVLERAVCHEDSTFLFNDRLFCFSGTIPYSWLFPRCAVAVHHGGSGSTAAALHAGIPQVVCPFLLDQFYWAERLCWLGVAPEPLQRQHLIPDDNDISSINQAAGALSRAIKMALSPEVKAQAATIAHRISSEDGIGEALKALKEKVIPPFNEGT
ncbi:sterol 3-beta-glucosyltransferase UGT80B1 isoform X1 [Typha angustifolia]|uniref:sterol 3-beta-glucosyltransferase UGT80B1 isoform X1 n=1 Tax=Typha angustifolia TaxID=59011 RepID=UPI003C301375